MTSLIWKACANGESDSQAVAGGKEPEATDRPSYVVRAEIEGELAIGKLINDQAYIPYGGKEHLITSSGYEVLVNPDGEELEWVKFRGNAPPGGAIVGGKTEEGTTQYVGRTHVNSMIIPGKVNLAYSVLFYSLGGEEIQTTDFQILSLKEVNPPSA